MAPRPFNVGDDKPATQNECVRYFVGFQCLSALLLYGILKSLNPTSLSDSPKIILYSPIKHKTILATHQRHIIQIGHLLHCTNAPATPPHHTPNPNKPEIKKGRETANPPSHTQHNLIGLNVTTKPTPYHKQPTPDNRPPTQPFHAQTQPNRTPKHIVSH